MRVLSGIQPTGRLHIGNFFGCVKQWLYLQKDPTKSCFWMLADLHSLTKVLPSLGTSPFTSRSRPRNLPSRRASRRPNL